MRIQTALDRLCVRFFRRRMQKMSMPDVDGDMGLKEDYYTSWMINQTSRKNSILAETDAEPMQEEDRTGGVRRAFAVLVSGWQYEEFAFPVDFTLKPSRLKPENR